MTHPYADVIGRPISHSKSPLLHGFWLAQLGMAGAYHAVDVAPDGLSAYLASRRDDPSWRGCNITLPHKIAIMDMVDDPGHVRDSIGAMNTVFRSDNGVLTGTNTDAAGFFAPIADVPLEGEHAIVIGTGGAAHAILFALARAKIGRVTLLARNPLKGAAILARFGLKGDVKALSAMLPPAALLVNATQLGMAGQPALDIDLSPLAPNSIVYDIVYAPLETQLLAQAAARGLECVDGLEMLIGQAAVAFELFYGVAPPQGDDDALRDALLS